MRAPNTFEYRPGLATDWQSSTDYKSWTFHLREGVKFHENWGDLTGEDVKFTVEQNLRPDANKVAQSAHVAHLVGIEPLADKWRAFGWEVREIDGHDMGQIVDALDALPFNAEKPSALIAHTVKGKGVSFAENTYVWHSNTVNDETLARALAELETR